MSVSPNYCLTTLLTCSPQRCSAEVHGDLCTSAECCSVCIQAGTYTSVASMQSSLSALTLTATTLVWCIDIQCSLKRYAKEKQYMIYISLHIGRPALWGCLVHPRVSGPVFFFGIRVRLIFNSSNGFFKCLEWLCMASWFGLTITCFRFKKVSSSPSLQIHPTISCTWHESWHQKLIQIDLFDQA